MKKILSLLLLTFSLFSCSDDTSTNSYEIKFALSGDYTGTLNAKYPNANGAEINESITSLPWTKTIIYNQSVQSTTLTVTGSGGTAGQTLEIKSYQGGKKLLTDTETAASDGTITITSPMILF